MTSPTMPVVRCRFAAAFSCAALAFLLFAASTASARPGGYLTLSLGSTSVGGEQIGGDRLGPDSTGVTYPGAALPPTTEIDGGTTAMVRLGFNILGYAALEASVSGHGSNLSDADTRSWAAHSHVGPRIYPMWHWQNRLPAVLQPLEPSLYMGWGGSWQVYTPNPLADELGWSKLGSWRYGAGVEYFLVNYFKVMLDYNYVRASYDNFIYNLDDSINFPVQPGAQTGYHQIYLSVAFHFTPSGEAVRYAPPPVAQEQEALEPLLSGDAPPAASDLSEDPASTDASPADAGADLDGEVLDL